MSDPEPDQLGYAFALPQLVARLVGRRPRRAEFSRWEAYGLGILVFGMSVIFALRLVLDFLGPGALRIVALLFLPFGVWLGFLVFYFVNAQLAALLRRLRLYRAPTNNPFQHFVITAWTSWLALFFVRQGSLFLNSLGCFWLALFCLNLCAAVVLRFSDEP
jgi:hypothetical protein